MLIMLRVPRTDLCFSRIGGTKRNRKLFFARA